MPKENMYQSLHTTVVGPLGERIEIQIRTHEMDFIANEGIAAHWRYKEGKRISEKDGEKFSWLRQLLESQSELRDPKEFLQSLKIDLYPEEVYVFTPGGDILRFPVGATPLDFAYSVHTELGHHCKGAVVNDQIVPLNYELKSGDIVKILKSSKAAPSKDWLRIAKTSRARTKIKTWLRAQEREQSINLGREMLEKALAGYRKKGEVEEPDLDNLAREFSLKSGDDLLASLGFGRISVHQLMHKIVPEAITRPMPKRTTSKKKVEPTGVRVKGVENLLIRFAKCCRPLPGDDVVGFITRGRGITVHRSNCPYVSASDPQRLVPVEWDTEATEEHEVEFSVLCQDKPGMLGSITATIGSENVNITKATVQSLSTGNARCVFRVMVKDLAELKGLFKKIHGLKGIENIKRLQSF